MLSYLLSAVFIGLASAKCKFFNNPSSNLAHGIQYCNVFTNPGTGEFFSVWYDCVNETHIAATTFDDGIIDCNGNNVTVLYTGADAEFDCTTATSTCARRFLLTIPCDCTVGTDCVYIADLGVAPGTCFTDADDDTMTNMVTFDCIEVGSTASETTYDNAMCSGDPTSTQLLANTCMYAYQIDDKFAAYPNTTQGQITLCSTGDFTTMTDETTMEASAMGLIAKTLLAFIAVTPLLF